MKQMIQQMILMIVSILHLMDTFAQIRTGVYDILFFRGIITYILFGVIGQFIVTSSFIPRRIIEE